VTGNRHEAEEAMQDAFARIWERWDVVQSFANPTGYLYRAAMNVWRIR
jgi:DNA-directed RNA polymerase specialized sigma24 family protein